MRPSFANAVIAASLIAFGSAATMSAHAETTSETRSLGKIEALKASLAVEVEIQCGASNKVVITGAPKEIKDIRTELNDGKLTIDRYSLTQSKQDHIDISITGIQVVLTVAKPLQSIGINTAASAKIPACALSPQKAKLSASTGSSMSVAAMVEDLTLDTSTGATIAPPSDGRLEARSVDVHASTGGVVKICKADLIEGKASLGGVISYEQAVHADVQTAMGGSVQQASCH